MTIKKSLIINLAGFALPLIVGVAAIPLIIERIGVEKFGILTVAWAIVGYFSLFDFGIGRALTKLVAERLNTSPLSETIPSLVWSGIFIMLVLGLVFLSAVLSSKSYLAESVLKVSVGLKDETELALTYLGISIPFTLLSNGVRGVIEGYQRFDLVNYVRVPQAILNYAAPLAVSYIDSTLDGIVLSLVLMRFFFLIISIVNLTSITPKVWHGKIKASYAKDILRFGGWLTISNIIAPVMLYADRFFISSILTVAVVAYYTTPFEMVTKLWIIPGAVIGVVFPAFSRYFVSDPQYAVQVYRKSQLLIMVLIAPVVSLFSFCAKDIIGLWISYDFANNSYGVATIIAYGVFANSLAQISAAFIQAAGRPDVTAKINLIEIIPYLWYLPFLCSIYGIEGAAMAWLIRCGVNALILAMFAEFTVRAKCYAVRI